MADPATAAPTPPSSRYDSDLPSPWRGLLLALLAVGLAVAAYFYFRPGQTPSLPIAPVSPPPVASPSPAPAPSPTVQFPIEQAVQSTKPPAALTLQDSDAAAQASLIELFGSKAVAQLFRVDNVVRRIVATVDALPREKASQRLMPLKPVGGQFIVAAGADGNPVIAPENAVRYDVLVQLFARVDTKTLVGSYANHYSLFQQAYRELGYPQGYFNDRLIAAIDSMLATPDIPGPIALAQPKVFYEFARPELEALPAAQKIMLRIGPENARTVKAKLREVRQALTGIAK
jgi:hypothetical protein